MGGLVIPNEFYIRRLANGMTTRGFAINEIAADRWRKYTAPTNVHYAENLRAMILRPDPALRDMVLANHTTAPSGYWETCTPPNTGAVHLLTLLASATASSLTSTYTLPDTPCLALSLVRAAAPAGYEASQRWQFTFGSTYRLDFGGSSTPTLYKSSAELSRAYDQAGDRGAYLDRERLRIELLNLAGRLYIVGLTTEPWIVPDVTLPAATWTLACNAGAYAVNVTTVRFATTGSFDTPSIEHWSAGYAAPTTSVLPPAPAGTTATVAIAAEAGSTKSYRISMTGNGYTTPMVQVASIRYPEVTTANEAAWLSITPYVTSADESRTQDLTAGSCTVDIDLTAVHDGKTFMQAIGGALPAGQYEMYYTVGIPGGLAERRMTGIVKVAQTLHEPRGETLQLTCMDKWARLRDRKLVWAPVMAGMTVTQAIETTANLAGYTTDEVLCVGLVGTLDSPTHGTDSPPWLPASGTSCAEWLEQIAEAKGVMLWHDYNGILTAYMRDNITTTVVADYTTAPGTARSVDLSRVELTRDYAGVVNEVIVEGRTPEGDPIFGGRWSASTIDDITDPQYLGYPATEYVRDENLTDLDAVTAAVQKRWTDRAAGRPRVTISSDHPDSTLCSLYPFDYITVTDDATGATGTYRVVGMTIRMEKYRNVVAVEAEEIEAVS